MPIWETMQIFYKNKGRQCRFLIKSAMRQTAGDFFLQKMAFFKMARKRAHEVRTAITSNLPKISRSDLFSEYDSL